MKICIWLQWFEYLEKTPTQCLCPKHWALSFHTTPNIWRRSFSVPNINQTVPNGRSSQSLLNEFQVVLCLKRHWHSQYRLLRTFLECFSFGWQIFLLSRDIRDKMNSWHCGNIHLNSWYTLLTVYSRIYFDHKEESKFSNCNQLSVDKIFVWFGFEGVTHSWSSESKKLNLKKKKHQKLWICLLQQKVYFNIFQWHT